MTQTCAFVGRHHAVCCNQEGAGDVVGDDFQAWFFHAERRRFRGQRFEQVLEQVDFVVAVDMLHDGGHTFKPMPYQRMV